MNITAKTLMLQNIVNAAAVLYDEPTLIVTADGVRFRGMDPSHIAMIDATIPPSDFTKYEVPEERKFAIRTGEISKVLKRFDKKGEVDVGLEDAFLTLSSEGKTFKIRTLDAATGETPIPKLNLNVKMDADKATIERVLGDVNVVADFVNIGAKGDSASFQGKGDGGEANVVLGKDVIEELVVKEESKATYSLDYVIKMVQAVDVDKVTLEFSSKMPLKVILGRVIFFLAPRVADE